jgi:hypothetical protein
MMKPANLLVVDAGINLVLGILLVVFPQGLVSALGIPDAAQGFYPNILGGVLFGIGIALLIERYGGTSGLGLAGAASINLCGGLVLTGWLLFGSLALPLRGSLLLWGLALVLVVLSSVELAQHRR